jgi:predicted RNase H-like nuclease
MRTQTLAGLDGCRAGFVAAISDSGAPGETRIEVVPDPALFLARPFVTVAVDMPIGLPERIGPAGRGPEKALRARLGARQSSVFAIPSRAAVFAPDYAAACAAALATSDPPRKVSRQAFALFPKIRALDALLRADPALVAIVHEAHPEGAFAAMAGAPLAEPKKAKGAPYPPGLDERRALLAAQGFDPALLSAPPPPGAGRDDVLDALACLWTARRLRDGLAVRHGHGERDAFGLPIAIWS